MADYRYLFYDLSTRRLIDALPMKDVWFSYELSGVGTLSGNIPLYADELSADRVRDAVLPYRTKIFVERDGQLRWGGWINREPTYDSATGVVQVEAEESLGYFAHRFLPTLEFNQQDQLDIARSLIDVLQVEPGGDMWINTDSSVTSGVMRDRSYSELDRTPALQALTQLSEVIDGFEFATQVVYGAGQAPHETLLLGYPRLGRVGAASGLVLEFDRFAGTGNIEAFRWADAGVPVATRVWTSCETDEGVQLTARAERPDLIEAGYPVLEASEQFDGVTDVNTLVAHAAALQAFRSSVRISLEITVRARPGLELGDWLLGDDVLVRISDWRFPPGENGAAGFQQYLRLVAVTVTPGAEGEETYQFTMGDFGVSQ